MSGHTCAYSVVSSLVSYSCIFGILSVSHQEEEGCKVYALVCKTKFWLIIGIATVHITWITGATTFLFIKFVSYDNFLFTFCIMGLLFTSSFDSIITIISSLFRSSVLCEFFNHIIDLDSTFFKDCHENCYYFRQERTNLLILIFGTIFILFSGLLDFFILRNITSNSLVLFVWCTFKTVWFLITELRMKLYFMTGILLTHKFELLNLKMKTLIKVDKTLKALEEHRRIHSSLLETIKVFDRIFDPDILLSLLATAVHVVLLLFLAMIMLTTFHGTTQWHWFFYQLTFTSLGFVSFLRIAGTAVVGDRLAGKAREPLRIIHELDLTKYDSAVQMQLLMFCNQISSRQLHPTAAGFFNLSKQMVCTVASILATYVIVLMQFKSND